MPLATARYRWKRKVVAPDGGFLVFVHQGRQGLLPFPYPDRLRPAHLGPGEAPHESDGEAD